MLIQQRALKCPPGAANGDGDGGAGQLEQGDKESSNSRRADTTYRRLAAAALGAQRRRRRPKQQLTSSRRRRRREEVDEQIKWSISIMAYRQLWRQAAGRARGQ